MSRIVDESYFTYSAYNALTSGIQVKCPKCHGAGVVTADGDNAYFRCLTCGHQENRDRTIYRYDVHNQCKNCGRYYPLNREHLAYLISYLSADLREKPSGSPKMTQADHLPIFMKTAKNRERIVKLLKKLQEG